MKTKTYLSNKRAAYQTLINEAKLKGAWKVEPIYPLDFNQREIGIKAYFSSLNEKGNTVSRTDNTFMRYEGGEELFVGDLFFNL